MICCNSQARLRRNLYAAMPMLAAQSPMPFVVSKRTYRAATILPKRKAIIFPRKRRWRSIACSCARPCGDRSSRTQAKFPLFAVPPVQVSLLWAFRTLGIPIQLFSIMMRSLVSLIFLLISALSQAQITVAHLSDTHIDLATAPGTEDRLRQAVEMINARNVDAV